MRSATVKRLEQTLRPLADALFVYAPLTFGKVALYVDSEQAILQDRRLDEARHALRAEMRRLLQGTDDEIPADFSEATRALGSFKRDNYSFDDLRQFSSRWRSSITDLFRRSHK